MNLREPVALRCPSCASPLIPGDLGASRGFIQCSHCGTALTLGSPEATSNPSNDSAGRTRSRQEIPLPTSLQVTRVGDNLEIRRRWFTPAVLFLVFFCIAWDSFLVFWYSKAVGGNAPWIAIVFPLVHVAVGVGLTYSALASLFNSTVITVRRADLTIRHGPFPWAGNLTLERGQIDQLYCRRHQRQQRHGTATFHEVWLKSRDGRTRKILGNGIDLDQALAIEQQIERALGIPDRQVPGEIER
jgi:hypothetical protein